MAKKKRIQRTEKFKFKVALEVAKGLKTINELASEYQINAGQISQWKRKLLAEGTQVFKSNQAQK